jgi:hypothetical protein
MLDLDGELRLDMLRKGVYKLVEFFEIGSWHLVGCTPSFHDCIEALWDPCWNMARFATREWPGLICYGWNGFGIEE